MNPKSIYLVSRFFMSFAFNVMFTAAIIYRIDVVNLEIYQLILLGTALEIAVLAFEVPTGVVAIGAFFSLPVLYYVTAFILLVPVITAYFLPKTIELDDPVL